MTEQNLDSNVEPVDMESKVSENSYDNYYRNIEIQRTNGDYMKNVGTTKAEIIKVLISALGTMVQEPEFETDPNNIGKKQFKMYIQKPILNGEDRQKVSNKLIEVIDSL